MHDRAERRACSPAHRRWSAAAGLRPESVADGGRTGASPCDPEPIPASSMIEPMWPEEHGVPSPGIIILGVHLRALPVGRGVIETPARSGDRPRPGRPCSRRLSPRAWRGARGVACIPDDRHGRRLADFSVGGTLASGAGDQLFRDEWGGGVGDLARDGCCLVSSMIASPEHGWLGGAAVLVRNGAICAEPLGALPLGLGQADALAVDGLTAAPGTVAGRTAGGLPLNR